MSSSMTYEYVSQKHAINTSITLNYSPKTSINIVLACLSGVKDPKIILSRVSSPIIGLFSRIPVNQNSFVGYAIISSKMDDCSNVAFASILVPPHPIWTTNYSQTNLHVSFTNLDVWIRSEHETFKWRPFWATVKAQDWCGIAWLQICLPWKFPEMFMSLCVFHSQVFQC